MSSMRRIRVLLVDPHAIVRAGYRMLLEAQPQLKVAGEATSLDEAMEIAARATPDVILLDLGSQAIDAIRELTASCPARVLVLDGGTETSLSCDAARCGAMGVVNKNDSVQMLIKAIEKVHTGEPWFDRSVLGSILSQAARPPKDDPEDRKIASLTARERSVVALIAEGLKNKQIAERLFISETTVTHHLSSIFAKLGVSDRLELVIYAFANNLASMPVKAETRI